MNDPMSSMNRRDFLAVASTGALASSCAAALRADPIAPRPAPAVALPPASTSSKVARDAGAAFAWSDDERKAIAADRPDFAVVVRGCADTAVLRTRARAVPPGLDLDAVAARMERTMRDAAGVGIAGPQVGLSLRVATLLLDYKTDKPRALFVRNPVIAERSDETLEGYEGCLSVPDVGGLVRRNSWLRLEYDAADGTTVSTEAEGYNAVLWQHELDHLDGVIYLDRLLGELLPMDEVRRRRKEAEDRERAAGATPPDQARRSDCLEGASAIIAWS
jgi:peptide deformylase